jgi:hypothetical protein
VIERARSGRAYTRSLLHGTGLTRTTRGMGRMVDLRGRWWLNELAAGIQVSSPVTGWRARSRGLGVWGETRWSPFGGPRQVRDTDTRTDADKQHRQC